LFNAPAVVTGFDPKVLGVMRTEYENAVAPELLDDMNSMLEADYALQVVTKAADRAVRESQNEKAMQEFMRADSAAKAAKAAFDSSL